MSKFTNFLLGTFVGAAAGFVAGALLVDEDQINDVKKKLQGNEKLQDLKKKYDNGTEIVKNQLASFPKSVDDDSELKDFDDIVIDDSKDEDESKNAEHSAADLDHAEKDDNAGKNDDADKDAQDDTDNSAN